MINFRRFPGVLFRHKTHFGLVVVLALSVLYLMHRWGFMCTNQEINREIERLCKLYKIGEAVGNLCKPLCVDKEIHSISCISQHSKKQFVFTAKWKKRLIVVKSSLANHPTTTTTTTNSGDVRGSSQNNTKNNSPQENTPKKQPEVRTATEEDFERMIRRLVRERLNMTLTRAQLDDLKFLEVKNKLLYSEDSENRKTEKMNAFHLLQSQEYLLSRLFSEIDVFPQVLGTCGHFYGVEYLESPKFNSMFTLDDKEEWSERMKLAISVMDFVEELETNFPDALHLCDVKMNHLGIAKSGRIKFLDLDLVYMKNVIDKNLRSGRKCSEHKDCDWRDCKSICNLNENVCDAGVANDNLQTICKKIFIGWTMSGKLLIPGLLMSEYTPASLSALLRVCAENEREPVPEDLRQRLYTTLTEMHQILVQKFLAK